MDRVIIVVNGYLNLGVALNRERERLNLRWFTLKSQVT